MEYILITMIIIPFILFLWAFINCLKGKFEGNNKIIWILAILFAPFVGSVLYLVIGRKQRFFNTLSYSRKS